MQDVSVLIPHRKPFLFVDELVSYSIEEIVGKKIFSDADGFLTGTFPGFNFVPGVVQIEAMAQCGGAGIKKLGLASGYFELVNVEHAHFSAVVEHQKVFKMVITNIKIGEKIIKQRGKGLVDDKLCVDATWTCVKFSD